jgi:U3 small nucleolar RNA-associated protein 3
MGKKRKSGRSSAIGPAARQNEEEATTITAKYDQNEQFADSQDEFFAGKDEIMLEEGPSRKRRKQLDEEGNTLALTLTC